MQLSIKIYAKADHLISVCDKEWISLCDTIRRCAMDHFENRPAFGKVMGKSRVSCFFVSRVQLHVETANYNYNYCKRKSIKLQLETKASSHAGQCTPAGSSVRLPRRVLITMSIITISRKLCIRLFTLCKISTTILRILWRHLQRDLRNV